MPAGVSESNQSTTSSSNTAATRHQMWRPRIAAGSKARSIVCEPFAMGGIITVRSRLPAWRSVLHSTSRPNGSGSSHAHPHVDDTCPGRQHFDRIEVELLDV